MPNFATSSALVETATKCLATAAGSFQSLEGPVARRVRVGHRLQSRKGLRRDDEQRLLGIEVAGGLGEVGAVDIGNKAEGQFALAVVPQGFIGHHRPQVRPADADIDDIADRLAGVAFPLPAAHPVGKGGHLVQHGMDLGHDVFAVHDNGLPFGARRATCRTARFSVTLILSPRNMASMRDRRPDSSPIAEEA